MNLDTVITFFDGRAAAWDTQRQPDEQTVNRILNAADIQPGDTVLDVACGTGVLFPYYLNRSVARITGVDVSQSMIAEAKRKFSNPCIHFVCADAQAECFAQHDKCVVFNALPHFANPELLIGSLRDALRPGGRLTIAHSENRHKINERHQSRALEVSHSLMPAAELAVLFEPYFRVDHIVDDADYYLVSGKRI